MFFPIGSSGGPAPGSPETLPTGPTTPNAPVVTDDGADGFLDDDLSHVLNGDVALTATEAWFVELIPLTPGEMVQGWLCLGATATAEGGPMIRTGLPVPVEIGAVATKLSFMRDPMTPKPFKVYVWQQ